MKLLGKLSNFSEDVFLKKNVFILLKVLKGIFSKLEGGKYADNGRMSCLIYGNETLRLKRTFLIFICQLHEILFENFSQSCRKRAVECE